MGYHNTGLYDRDRRGAYPAGNQGLIRTPGLRNVAVTAPYMHDGSAATLDQVLDDYAAGGRAARKGARSPLTSPLVADFTLSAPERADLLAFLEALTDRQFLASEALRSPFR
jgi:cytochrome c peroxidase